MASDLDVTPFVLKSIKGLDSSAEKKGAGAYGTVYKVTVKGATCIAKRLHDILVTNVSSRERASIQRKFVAECALLSKLRHPNVVHFVGVHYGRSTNDLSLVMECLHTDLAEFLEGCSNEIPLSIKLSILLDVSYGLLYFHTHSPPIIHRDLSANNILLTTDLRAKIADLGVAKLLDPQKHVAIAQTQAPGALYYMPPEALQQNPVYDFKLDIFSFGHLTLYVAAEKFPSVHELSDEAMYAALQKSTVQIGKRREAIEQIGEEKHTLYPLITWCLQDRLERRPTTTELNNSLKEMCTKYPHSVAELSNLMAQKPEAELYKEDFTSERREREVAYGRVADHERKYAQDVGELKAKLAQTEKNLLHHQDRLADVEQLYQRREKEMRSVLEEASKNQQEVQAKTSQVKQYKKQVDTLKTQVAELQKHNEELIQEMDKVMTELEKKKPGKAKKKPSDAPDPSKVAELERRNKELMREKEKLFKELDKTRKELEKKTEAEKKLAKNEQLYETLRNENERLQKELNECRRANLGLKKLLTHGSEHLPLPQSRESSESPMTPVVDLPRASHTGQLPPRILDEDEEIEQEKIKQTLDMQFHKQRQSFQFMEEQTSTAGAGILYSQAIPKARVPAGYAHGLSPSSDFAAQFNIHSGADIGSSPTPVVHFPHPHPPHSRSTPPTMSPSDPEMHPLPPHASGLSMRPPHGHLIPRKCDQSHLGVTASPLRAHSDPLTQPAHPLASQYGDPIIPHWRPVPNQGSTGAGLEQPVLYPGSRQDQLRNLRSPVEHQHPQDHRYPPVSSPTIDPNDPQLQQNPEIGESPVGTNQTQIAHHPVEVQQEVTGNGQPQDHYPQVEPMSPIGESLGFVPAQVSQSIKETHSDLPEQHPRQDSEQHPEVSESKGYILDQSIESIIHAQVESVVTEVGGDSSHRMTLRHVPFDPNLTCPMCNRGFRYGEIQKYRLHVTKQCTGSRQETVI